MNKKRVNIYALILTIVYLICFVVLCFFIEAFNAAFWVAMIFIFGVPIITSFCINEISWKSLSEGFLACLIPFFSFYFMIAEMEDFDAWSIVLFFSLGFIMLCICGITL